MRIGNFEAAFEAGADIACIIAATTDEEISKAVAVAKRYGRKVMADLIGLRDHIGEEGLIKRAGELERLGVDYICYHISVDDQIRGKTVPPESVNRVANEVTIPVASRRRDKPGNCLKYRPGRAQVIIVGGAINKAKNPREYD